MIDWINDIIKSKREQVRLADQAKEVLHKQALQEKISELKDLRRITINNVMYLKSYLNTLRSVVNCMKGASAAETRKKRQGARDQIKWVETKLKEEELMEIYWANQLRDKGIIVT